MYKFWSRLLVVLSIVLLTAVMLLAQGCNAGNRSTKPESPPTAKEALREVVYKNNWMLTVASLGVAASVFAMMMGLGKVGIAGLVASATSTAYTMATIRYSWLISIGGLLVGVVAMVAGFNKNRKTIFGFIDGFQDMKSKLGLTGDAPAKTKANDIMCSHTTALGDKLVKKRKAKLNAARDQQGQLDQPSG